MLKKPLFIFVVTIAMLGWSLPIMAGQSGLTTSFKTNATNVNTPNTPNPILNPTIIWNNGGTIVGYSYSSQKDTIYPFVSQTADDFKLTQNMRVTDVHWWGWFWNGTGFDPCNFYIYFYADNGTGNAPTGGGMADPAPTALATYYFPAVTGLPLDPNSYYEYNVNLSPPFIATANVKYWIAIQAKFPYPPQWGWTQTSGTQLHSAVQGFPVAGLPFWSATSPVADVAFYLTGEAAESLYWKPSYPDYAPSGMPDLDQHQDNWYKYETQAFSFCGPVAVANCFKWFDSKYNNPAGVPGDGVDMFPLVRQYISALGGMLGPWDDHDPFNMNHQATPWLFGGTPAPPPTMPQPFVPGAQPPGMPPWGELVERLAWYFNTDGVRTQYCSHSGTNVIEMQTGIQEWLQSEHFQNGSTLADTFCEKTWQKPTFGLVDTLVEKCEDVILLLGFWWYDGAQWWRCGGHYVTVAGVNSRDLLIAFSDPAFDNAEAGGRGTVLDGHYITHPHGSHDATIHNDEGNVSHDIYSVVTQSPSPGGLWMIPDYPVTITPGYCYDFNGQNVPIEFQGQTQTYQTGPLFTEVEYAVQISPWDYRGDASHDGVVDVGDVVYLINYLFKGGPAPVPFSEGDVNCDGVVDVGDVVFLINYLFKGGPASRCCDP